VTNSPPEKTNEVAVVLLGASSGVYSEEVRQSVATAPLGQLTEERQVTEEAREETPEPQRIKEHPEVQLTDTPLAVRSQLTAGTMQARDIL
jgi:hypothetical protein